MKDVTLTQGQQIEKRLQEMPLSCRNNYHKAMRGRSMKSAIKAFCSECVGWQREEVKLCTDLGCPLYPYRPTSYDYKAYAKSTLEAEIQPPESLNSESESIYTNKRQMAVGCRQDQGELGQSGSPPAVSQSNERLKNGNPKTSNL